MDTPTSNDPSRREVLKTTAGVAAASALAAVSMPQVYAAEDNTIRVALVGAGGRGTGAAANALSTKSGPIKLVAMADVFPNRLAGSLQNLQGDFGKQVDVPAGHQFIGFDAYKKAMDSLRPGDVVILTTPPAFRWVHFTYAIEKNLNVFMEKPITVDGPTTRKMLELGKESVKRNLKVGVGLMCRHCVAREELFKRIKDGQIGDLTLLRAYRMKGPEATCFSGPCPKGESELLYQISRFHSFLWLSGGSYSDFLIHNIDECCWMKDAWPVKAIALGGRHYRGNNVDQNFDSYSVEYSFADGAKLYLEGRTMPNCAQEFASFAHGTKGSAVISSNSHAPSRCRLFKSQKIGTKDDIIWKCMENEPNPYQTEWDRLIDDIRNNKPHNEVERGAQASLVTSMGRMAAHTGRLVTYEDILNLDHEFAPEVDKLTLNGPSPLPAGQDGRYPVPQPGIQVKREY
jgi:predicted dehydrogenase